MDVGNRLRQLCRFRASRLNRPTNAVYKRKCSLYVPFMNYRRLYIPGGTYAFTVCLKHRRSRMLVDKIDELHRAMARVQNNHPFETIAWCVLPNHLHVIWTLPENDHDFSTRWRLIKHGFTRTIGQTGLWQNRFWEHHIRDEHGLGSHMDYVHWNPVKHGFVADPAGWPHSSWHRYENDWGRAASVDSRMNSVADMDAAIIENNGFGSGPQSCTRLID